MESIVAKLDAALYPAVCSVNTYLSNYILVFLLVAVGLFPVTGQPLPLISRGGTSTLINCVYIGMILSVSRYAKQVAQPQHTQFDGPMTEIRHE